MVQTGEYTKIIDILSPAEDVEDGAGGIANDSEFDTLYSGLWAKVEQLNGKRALQFGDVKFTGGYEVRIPYLNAPELNVYCKIEYNGKRLTIHSLIDEQQENWEWVILAYGNQSTA